MNRKRILSLLQAAMLLTALSGCSSKVAVTPENQTPAPQPENNVQQGETAEVLDNVKTGLSITALVSDSVNADAGAGGAAKTDVTLVAVTVDDQGVIQDCVIDMVQTEIGFDAQGNLTADPAAEFLSKNELGRDYGMHTASSIGREWNEQAAALAEYVTGRTAEEVKGISIDESGRPTGADLSASVTISIGDFVAGIEKAVYNAAHLGARKGDTLKLEAVTSIAKSGGASSQGSGAAQTDVTVAAVTLRGDVITSCHIDAVQPSVSFDAAGQITSDLSAPIFTKNELGSDYGMHEASSIGQDWHEQAGVFAAYVTGKTFDEVAGIAVDESARPADADLSSSVTLSIGDFQAVLAKAAP